MERITGFAAGILLLTAPTAGFAGGFAVSDKSVSNRGRAFAGGTALAEDASTIYNNPAGMQGLDTTLSLGLHRIAPDISFKSDTTGETTSADNKVKTLPNLYYVHALNERARVGVGMYAPFGLGLGYPDGWEGRYHATDTDLKTLNVSAAFSYQATPGVALGASIDAQQANADLQQAVDYGTICVAKQMEAGLTQAQALAGCDLAGLQPQQDDGTLSLNGDSMAYGYSLGLAAQLAAHTKFGFAYHSSVKQKLEGDAAFSNVPAVPGFEAFSNTEKAAVELELPPTATLAVAHELSYELTLFADYTWTGWSTYDELRVDFKQTLPDSVSEKDWSDGSRYALGANYRLNPKVLLRAGYALEETPVPNAENRDPRSPDSDRNWYAIGANIASSDKLSFDISYAYVENDKADINNTDSFGHNLKGSYDNSFDYLSAQLNWRI